MGDLSKGEEELRQEIFAAMKGSDRSQCIRDLERLYARAAREGFHRAALVALQLLQPQLVLAGHAARAEEVDRLKEQLNQRPDIKAVVEAPMPPTIEALIERTTSPACVYLAVDMDKALRLRPRAKRVTRLQALKREARQLGCEATTMKGLELLRDEFKKPADRRRLAQVLREIEELNEHYAAMRRKAEEESKPSS